MDEATALDISDELNDASAGEERLRAAMLETLGALSAGVVQDFQAGAQAILDHTLRLKSRLDVTITALSELLTIETAARRLLQSGAQWHELSRLDGPAEILDLNEIIRNLPTIVQAACGGHPTFTLELDSNLPRINGRRALLAHALVTLFLRSAREMQHGGAIRVRTGRIGAAEAAAVGLTEAFAGAVWIAIKDQSPGYPYERREQICQALKNGILDNCPDIAFVLESVQRHEGTLLLETQAGRGTTWTLYLPALLGFENDFSFTEQMPATDCKGTILLVDDEPLICGVGRRVLESSGYRVITALSGTAAIDAYRRHADDVDLVLLDVILPDQGGLEVLKAIRRMNRSAKVLIASGYATEGGIRDTLNETGAGFVQKPYRVKELLAKVEKALLQ